jgi:hypothetical protein
VYSALSELEISSYLTTNYDGTLETCLENKGFTIDENFSDSSEKVYSIRRKRAYHSIHANKLIWHIHGEARYPKSVMLGFDQYCGSVGRIGAYLNGKYEYGTQKSKEPSIIDKMQQSHFSNTSWIDLFFTNNIHIIGFGLDYSEQDIWYILNKRQRLLMDSNIPIENKIYFYIDVGHTKHRDEKLQLLDSFGVNVIEYCNNPTTNDEWEKLYLKIIEDISKML